MDRLHKHGACTDDRRCSCGNEVETHQHLFFVCHFALNVWQEICSWLGYRRSSTSVQQTIVWLRRRRLGSAMRQRLLLLL
ncbi:putative potassium transport system protein kup [Bienertia sinuspersici]